MSYFLRNSAGFFIQLAAGGVLCLLPFSKDVYRVPYKKVWIGCGVLVVLSSIFFPLFMQTSVVLFSNGSIKANLYMLFFLIILVALYFWIILADITKKLFVLFLVIFYEASQFLLVNLFTPLYPGGILWETYPPLILTLYGVTAAVLFPLMSVMMLKTVRPYLAEVEMENIRREFRIVLVETLLCFIVLLYYSSVPKGGGIYWWQMAPMLLFLVAIQFVFFWSLMGEAVRRRRESEARRTMKIQQFQYEKIKRDMENDRRMRHDMRHYLNGLYEMLEQNRMEEMKACLLEVMESTAKRENEIYCRNLTVNGLLQYYIGLARTEDIQCKVQADCGDITISPADLSVLFGNAMENAIRACKECKERRWIVVKVGVIGGSLVIQISNSCEKVHLSGRYRSEGNFLPAKAFLSTRSGGGYGLASLDHTAMKYGGNARFQFDDVTKTFITQIRLNLHPEML